MDMVIPENISAIEAVAARLRAMVLDRPAGTLIGSEEALVSQLGCSRSTVRQVARLLEREGLLKVRRGINGGYFSARPDAGTIEATVSAYLQTIEMDPGDITILASALWAEAVRKAAALPPAETEPVAARLRRRINAIPDRATFDAVRNVELETQAEIFRLANSSYIKLIFDINVAFSNRRFPAPIIDDDSAEHLDFVRKWRDAKLMELAGITSGDRELAVMAAQHSRKIWQRRLKRRFASYEQ